MQFGKFGWERQVPLGEGAALSIAEIEYGARLPSELPELTQSRRSYAAVSAFLDGSGLASDGAACVPADVPADRSAGELGDAQIPNTDCRLICCPGPFTVYGR